MRAKDFGWLLNPIDKHTFLAEYFEQKHLLIKRKDPNYYQHLLTFSDFNELLSAQVFTFPDCRLIDNARGGTIPAKEYTNKQSSHVNPQKLINGYSQGATIAIAGLHNRHKSLLQFCSQLVAECSHKFQANTYLTPPNAKGFTPHWDTHDVFVLQLHGKKHWQIYGNDKPLALKSEEFVKEGYEPSEVSADFWLEPGDLLYIPRGFVHDASTEDESSLHITLGLLGTTWLHHIGNALEALGDESLMLRKYLPFGFENSFDDAAYHENVKAILKNLDKLLARGELWQEEKQYNEANGVLFMPNHLKSVAGLPHLQLTTVVKRRLKINYQENLSTAALEATVLGNTLELPKEAGPIISFINDKQSAFKVADLPDILDDESKIFIAGKLITLGCLSLL